MKFSLSNALMGLFASLCAATMALPALAEEALKIEGHAVPKQWNFQPAATDVMQRLTNLHNGLEIVAFAISVFVLVLMIIVVVRFSEKRNPTPSKTTHNTVVEIIWTVVPILILIGIAIPSMRLHYDMSYVENPEMTLKVTGQQWYWHYDYPDQGGISFDSYLVKEEDQKPGDLRLLTTDNKVVVPVDTTIRVLMTGGDVIHSWAMPAFGVKRDTVPGRLNETWFRANKTGIFFGQCSELCGVGHGFMPIEVHVVSKEAFKAWVEEAKKKFAANDGSFATAALAQ
jgi:cytochrome c oxidase subunit II